MNKRKSITLLVISIVLILLLGVMTFCPVVVPLGNVDYHSPVTLIEYGLDLKGGSFVTFEVNKNDPNYRAEVFRTNLIHQIPQYKHVVHQSV